MKKAFLSLLAVCALLFLSACATRVYLSGSRILYIDFEDLASMATHILRVEVVSEHVDWHDPRLFRTPTDRDVYRVSTFSQVQILEIFQGENVAIGEVIEIVQAGGRLGRTEWINDASVTFAIGEDVILFLSDLSEFGERPFVLVGSSQGVYRVTLTETLAANASYMPSIVTSGTIESLRGNHITVTPDDLRSIAERNNIEVGMAISREALSRE